MKPLRTSDRASAFGAALAAATLLVAGCTSTSADSPTTGSTAASVLSTSQSSTSSSAVPSIPTTTSQITSSSVLSSSAAPTSEGPTSWPATFTADQATAAEAALTVYREAIRLSDEVLQNPAQPDIEAAVSSAITDPASKQLARTAAQMSAKGVHSTGYREITSAQALDVQGSQVSIESCIEDGATALVYDNGQTVDVPSPSGTRVKYLATVNLYSTGWLVSDMSAPQPYQPC